MYPALLLLISLSPACALLKVLQEAQRPSVRLERAEIASITLSDIQIRLHTIVTNPYPIPFPPSVMGLDTTIEGTNLAKLESKLDSIPAGDEKEVAIDVRIAYSDLMTIYRKLPGKEALTLAMKGSLGIALPQHNLPGVPQRLDLPFEAEKQIPAVLPSISIRNFRLVRPEVRVQEGALLQRATSYLDGLFVRGRPSPGSASASGLAGIDVNVQTEFEIFLKNEAAARLNFQHLNYGLKLNNENFLSGTDTSITNNGQESVITVRTGFPLASITSSLADIIRTRSANFHLTGDSRIEIPGLSGEPISFQFDRTGALSWQ